MNISPKKKVSAKSSRKVVIFLKDYDAYGKVYVELDGKMTSKEMMVEAFKRLHDGLIYADEACTELIDSEFIEVNPKRNTGRKDSDFVFLIDRAVAEDYIVSAKIIK